MRMSIEEFRAYEAKRKPKVNKYGNKTKIIKTKIVGGIAFQSTKEANHYQDLLIEQAAGHITGLRHQKEIEIRVNDIYICSYFADFVYDRNGKQEVEDVKSKPTRKKPEYRIKKKLLKAALGIEIQEI